MSATELLNDLSNIKKVSENLLKKESDNTLLCNRIGICSDIYNSYNRLISSFCNSNFLENNIILEGYIYIRDVIATLNNYNVDSFWYLVDIRLMKNWIEADESFFTKILLENNFGICKSTKVFLKNKEFPQNAPMEYMGYEYKRIL